MGMTSMREGKTQSAKMPRGFRRAARRVKGEGRRPGRDEGPRRGVEKGTARRLALETGEKKSEACASDRWRRNTVSCGF
ncbi:hypothetical protein PUN28_016758 [Cardiocondyla obscurior]|uniref:Uncharacterized protein n=1 Tax=Cardiocondyla obscurior TaxID=286306 RepID=A0AAW2EPT8_9HYME